MRAGRHRSHEQAGGVYWNSHKPHRGRQDRRRLGQLRRFRHDAAAGSNPQAGAAVPIFLGGVSPSVSEKNPKRQRTLNASSLTCSKNDRFWYSPPTRRKPPFYAYNFVSKLIPKTKYQNLT